MLQMMRKRPAVRHQLRLRKRKKKRRPRKRKRKKRRKRRRKKKKSKGTYKHRLLLITLDKQTHSHLVVEACIKRGIQIFSLVQMCDLHPVLRIRLNEPLIKGSKTLYHRHLLLNSRNR